MQRLVDLRSHRFRCFDQERFSLPLLKEKEFAKNRFKVNTSIEMVDGGHRNASMATRKIKILKQPTRNS